MNQRKLWVDDVRWPPGPDWFWAKDSTQAIAWIVGSDELDEISLDHDLGGNDSTRPVVLYLAEHGGWPRVVRVHTQNPVGREWLVGMVERYGPGVTS